VFLGFGRGPSYGDPAYTKRQQQVLDSCIKSGLRQFYFPPPLPGSATSYDWSFLRPVANIDLPPGVAPGPQVLPLPDDFGGLEGDFTVLSNVSQVTWPIRVYNEGQVRQAFSVTPAASGRPLMIAMAPVKGTTAVKGQRFQLTVFPLADLDYTLQFTYYVLPDYLSGAFPFVYGGSAHTETVLESCKAMAEQNLDDAMSVHTMKFQERLAASIAIDRKYKEQIGGYMGDRSDGPRMRRWQQHGWSAVQVQGVNY
jgi:hypothetical protein